MRNWSLKMSRVAACFASPLEQADLEHLAGIVPLVHGGVDVEALVALQPDQLRLEHGGEGPSYFRLPDSRLAFEQQRALEGQREIECRRQVPISNVALRGEGALQGIDRK